jgi:hypothetical protein
VRRVRPGVSSRDDRWTPVVGDRGREEGVTVREGAVLGHGLLLGLDQIGSPRPFCLFLFSFPFFFYVFFAIFA